MGPLDFGGGPVGGVIAGGNGDAVGVGELPQTGVPPRYFGGVAFGATAADSGCATRPANETTGLSVGWASEFPPAGPGTGTGGSRWPRSN